MIGLISIFLATSLVVNFIFYRGSSKYVVYSLSFLFIAFLQSHYWDFSFDSGGFRVTSLSGLVGGDDIKYAQSIYDDQMSLILGVFPYFLRLYSYPYLSFLDFGINASNMLLLGLAFQANLSASLLIETQKLTQKLL